MFKYKQLYPEHPIWHRFRDKKFHIKHYVMAPPGASINFLLAQLYPEIENSAGAAASKNEYVVSARMNSCDQLLLDNVACIDQQPIINHDVSHLDKVLPIVQEFYNKTPNEVNVIYGHEAPYVLLAALDLKIDIITSIRLDQDISWLAKSLQLIKNYQGSLSNAGTFKFIKILEQFYLSIARRLTYSDDISDFQFSRSRHTIHKLANDIRTRVPAWSQIQHDSPIVYMYYISATENKQPISLHGFAEYYTNLVQGFFEYDARRFVVDAICDSLSDIVKIHTINYTDLFFNLKIPQTEVWQHVNPVNISDYSRKNLVLLNSMCEILTEPVRGDVSDRLAAYADQLSRADGHHSTV